ncbi:peroxisomal 2,4-dienoyl-CoA reductase [Capsaspora owczarzaki ATCC 30864]|uniref:2,4-dienoyl-CoA reductase [(3E)-enoyl-CoA-producing] n=1 Tax=Capsaspora owczarzaki (strain ATCC 30864) TaxID=595528 RepID=A0A0D2X2D7_CAPO3|nr:peroxisomal 2,4-dienoyl-CoA reductase [Capsaspora owczarzaki ATCC 30864]KJE92379.1 peroxisomal 2,4-dienoyl-CoA reductase [Capsaspora owczarzaki ATCC 30864]|eukprot:XP_004364198.1 peroxisomal 2,4-dienoyl-CoA reductase [Capsaspora owczarzaki ATCC 30864]
MAATSTANVFTRDALRGKIAFVTGGGTGICKDIAQTLLEHGCAGVAIVSRKMAVLEQSARELTAKAAAAGASGVCVALAADVRVPEQIEKALADCVARFGKLDILVNGAAGNFLALSAKMSYNAFKTVIEIDLLGTFYTSRAAYPYLVKSKGNIINITMTNHYTGMQLQAHAGAAKSGIDAMTRHHAVEWGQDGIRVNAIAPGPIENTEGMSKLAPPGYNETLQRTIPLGRMGTVREVANAVLFLASEAASYVTGAILVVDGAAWMTIGGMNYPDGIEAFKQLKAKL